MDYLSERAKLHHLSLILLYFIAFTFATQANPVLTSATFQSPRSFTSAFIPAPAPSTSPVSHENFTQAHSFKHRKRHPHAATPPSFSLPLTPAICDEVSCADPLTLTPIGSPCACVLPIQIEIDLDVAPYQLFSSIAELELEVAAGTFLKQSQVRIMGASPNTEDPGKTTVTIDLVPLGDKFDNMTALLTFQRFWQKTVQINSSIFGDYNIVYVRYPGLPLSPPPISSEYLDPSGSRENPLTADVPATKMQKMNIRVIIMIALFSSILVLMCFIFVYVFCKCKRVGRATSTLWPPLTWSVTRKKGVNPIVSHGTSTTTSFSFISTMAPCLSSVKSFSLSELEKATNKFSSKKVLGEGGFGRVYLGVLEDKREVAIKLLTREDRGDREFIAEVEILSRLHHRNLVKLIGICIEGRRRCLVYELIRNGSVESHLHGPDKIKSSLGWDTRMKIALGAARGLAYLHEDSNPRVIHRDFKASNVLLEEDFTPKVSDFGLAREAADGTHHISTRVMGTFGYVAPEYAMTGHLLVKSDVYSYGVVLLELLSGRKPVDISRPNGSENLVAWARPLLTTKEGLDQLIDPSLPPTTDFDTIAKVAAIASLCVHIEASQRPFMGEVVQALKLIYNYTDEACEDCCSSPVQSTSDGNTRYLFDYSYTMEYSSGDHERLDMENRSGPLRIRKEKNAFLRLRGSESEPDSRQCRRSCMEGDWV